MSKAEEIVKKKYIAGNSLYALNEYLDTTNLTVQERNTLLLTIKKSHTKQRINTAKRDLVISLISIFYAIGATIFMIITKSVRINALFIVSIFLWIPFFQSAYRVLFSKNEFDEK